MGIKLFSSCSSCSGRCESGSSGDSTTPNPDPVNFNIRSIEEHGDFLIAEIYYKGCTNFEGKKILVFSGVTIQKLVNTDRIDPHFTNYGEVSPVARFVPTHAGWDMARVFVRAMEGVSNASS